MSKILLRVTLALAVQAGIVAPHAPAFAAAGQPLTFASRVACRTAVEDVYWRSRIWPASNPGPKPALAEIASSADLTAMVEESLAHRRPDAVQRRLRERRHLAVVDDRALTRARVRR